MSGRALWRGVAAVALAVALAGCGSGGEPASSASVAAVDLDTTTMSTSVAYAAVDDLLVDYADHVGATVRVAGTYSSWYDDGTDMQYQSVRVADVSACCGLEVEFVCDNGAPVEADEGDELVVTGTLDTYEYFGISYPHLVHAHVGG